MVYCPNCGEADVVDGKVKCPKCGEMLREKVVVR